MKESQFIDDYLQCNARRGYGKGYTVTTYLRSALRGRQKLYAGGYQRALMHAIARRVQTGEVIEGPSIHDHTAYYRMPFERYAAKWHDIICTIGRIISLRQHRRYLQSVGLKWWGEAGEYISGGFYAQWPENAKQNIRDVNHQISECLHELEAHRPYRAHGSTMWRIYRELAEEYIYQ